MASFWTKIGLSTPETSRNFVADPRNVQTTPRKRISSTLKSRTSIASLFNSRPRDISPRFRRYSPEIACEEANNYPLYDETVPEHNTALGARLFSAENGDVHCTKHSPSSKKGSFRLASSSKKSPQKTLVRFLQGLTESMRTAANSLHESEDGSPEFQKPPKGETKRSVRFRTRPSILEQPSKSSAISMREAPSLNGVAISRTPLLSLSSLNGPPDETDKSKASAQIDTSKPQTPIPSEARHDEPPFGEPDLPPDSESHEPLPTPMPGTNLTLDDPFDDTQALDTETKVEHELPLRVSHLDQSASICIVEDKSFPSNDEDTKCVDDDACALPDYGCELRGYLGDIESDGEVEEDIKTSTPIISDPKVMLMSSPWSIGRPSLSGEGRQRVYPLPLGETQNRPGLRRQRGVDKGLGELQTKPPNLDSMLLSPPSRDTSMSSYDADIDGDEPELPALGSRKIWLEVQNERASRYSEVISENSDGDEDHKAEIIHLSASENTAPRAFARFSDLDGWRIRSNTPPIIPDENVSPLILSDRTPSPAAIPLPTSRVVPTQPPWNGLVLRRSSEFQEDLDKSEQVSLQPSPIAFRSDDTNLLVDSPDESRHQATQVSISNSLPNSAKSSAFSLSDNIQQQTLPRLAASALAAYDPNCHLHRQESGGRRATIGTQSECHDGARRSDDAAADSSCLVVPNSTSPSQRMSSMLGSSSDPDDTSPLQGNHENLLAADEGSEKPSSAQFVSASASGRRVSLLNNSLHLSPAPPHLNLRDELTDALTPQRVYSGEVSSIRSEDDLPNSDWEDVEQHTSVGYPSVVGQAMRSLRIASDGLSPISRNGRRVMDAFRIPSPSGDSELLEDGGMLERSRGRLSETNREWSVDERAPDEEDGSKKSLEGYEW